MTDFYDFLREHQDRGWKAHLAEERREREERARQGLLFPLPAKPKPMHKQSTEFFVRGEKEAA